MRRLEPPTGHVFRRDGARRSVWYAKYRLPDGRQVQKRIGPAWTERGRPPAGYFTKRTADAWSREARGGVEIGRFARTLWEADRTYVAEPCQVIQARGTALVLGRGGVSVVRRGRDGEWRYAIALLVSTHRPTKEQR